METLSLNAVPRSIWSWQTILKLFIYFAALGLLLSYLHQGYWDNPTHKIWTVLAFVGSWRYGWWSIHFIRSRIYRNYVYPKLQRDCTNLLRNGWRPSELVVVITIFKERPDTLKAVLASIFEESHLLNLPVRIFAAVGDSQDSHDIDVALASLPVYSDRESKVYIVKQDLPGKRVALGLALRSLSRRGVEADTPIILMDSDTILLPGCLQRCLPVFALRPSVVALTTDETVTVIGPKWMQDWLDMRFAQRHLGMQSHALSNKVLTLTGRMSIFRASIVVDESFIRTLEADHLEHWLWGKFRFLSGDDKSTWYSILRDGGDMLYIPDAMVHTIEHISGNGYERMLQNFKRWSGNMLRNGSRALALGPRRVGWFIWWCVLDQRLAVWTPLLAPTFLILALAHGNFLFPITYLIWIAFSRMLVGLVLFSHTGRIMWHLPFIMFINQVTNSVVKVYVSFRLPMQKWVNRGNQTLTLKKNWLYVLRFYMARFLTTLWVVCFLSLASWYAGW